MLISIDPDSEKSAVAVFDNKTISIYNLSFVDLLFFIKRNKGDEVWIIEGCFLNQNLQHTAKNVKVAFKIGLDCGKNHDTAIKIIEILTALQRTVHVKRPLQKVWKKGKISKEELQNLLIKYGYTTENIKNQDVRDAILLGLDFKHDIIKQLKTKQLTIDYNV